MGPADQERHRPIPETEGAETDGAARSADHERSAKQFGRKQREHEQRPEQPEPELEQWRGHERRRHKRHDTRQRRFDRARQCRRREQLVDAGTLSFQPPAFSASRDRRAITPGGFFFGSEPQGKERRVMAMIAATPIYA
jgi:hypothetical protein